MACRRELVNGDRALVCSGCGQSFPLLGRVPILVTDARSRLSQQAASLGSRLEALNAEIDALEESRLDLRLRFRAAVLETRRQGLLHNRSLLQAELGEVLEAVVRSGGPHAGDQARGVGESFGEQDTGALFIDWGHSGEGEKEIATICELGRQTLGPPGAGARAVFLGAGTGRHAAELGRDFEASFALDLSLDRAWLFDRVLHRELDFAAFEDGAPRARDSLTHLVRTTPPAPIPGLAIAVADARRLPLPAASVTHAFSIYFTDMLPLSELLPEVARVLTPDGTFLHLGPLHYGFPDVAWRLAPDELAEAFQQFGFEIEGLRELPLERGRSSASGLHLIYQALIFQAHRR